MQPIGIAPSASHESFSKEDAVVYKAWSYAALSVDAVIEATGLVAAQVVTSLLLLELYGGVCQLPGQQSIRL